MLLRSLLFVLIMSLGVNVFAQESNEEVRQQGKATTFNNWHYLAGDNPKWGAADFDHRNWGTMDLVQPSKTAFLNFGNITWFRLAITPDDTRRDSLYSLMIRQFGASEVYVNGELIHRIGSILSSTDFKAYNPHLKLFPITLKKNQKNTIAIRFVTKIPTSEWFVSKRQALPDIISPLTIQLQPLQIGIEERESLFSTRLRQIGPLFLTGTFAVLFLMLFLFYPKEKLHLFFGLFNLFLLFMNLHLNFVNSGQYDYSETVYLQFREAFLSRLVGMSVLLFMLYALNKMRPFVWWYVIFVLLVDFPLTLLLPTSYLPVSAAFRTVIIPIAAWLAYHAFTSKRREDILVGLIALTVISVNASFALQRFWGLNINEFVLVLVPGLTFLMTVFYVAIRYSNTNKSLEHRIIQVEQLSAENLRQSKEKQDILSSQKQLLEEQVKERTAELQAQKLELQSALENLKSTQRQLIQSEKMASFGELTAGIAHEIQNPLNFVNNFSDVNSELVDEADQEIEKGNMSEAKTILRDIKENEQKINHHGKRADAIVKSMLQHSRSSSGVKELTDLNALCDEYLRLAYHGMKAKDKSFNANFRTAFDNSIGKIYVVPQDIGRVILNLINNAFYAVDEKKKSGVENYEPTVSVSTAKEEDKVGIKVKDNGNGIPQKVLDKIFQPFFTTKPTGQGTGLGLSLSYDIVKAHGGEIRVSTKEAEGTEFIINLPQ